MNSSPAHYEALSDHMSLTDVQRHYRGASKAWVYSNVSKGVLPLPYKVAGRSFWSRREIVERDDKRRLAEREAA